ncbi:hypothetical protein [Marivita sp. GX14005]|uniref:hypothetical protein n=1 Tax=Marivita sp. GX14005 TaxID=2942276 RepID=UPI002018CB1A|nr:hypothetical protein [Marivita sp. GX14005]MCL3881365.1 hypothetical protein [Marivita sp. GX14005]
MRVDLCRPPPGWPDIPVASLRIFRPHGRINGPPPPFHPPRFASRAKAEAFLRDYAARSARASESIRLRLSQSDGAEWTDIVAEGAVLAQVETEALIQRKAA